MRVFLLFSLVLVFNSRILAQAIREKSINDQFSELINLSIETIWQRINSYKGKERIDYLNLLSYKYRSVRVDSSRSYALQSYKEAMAIRYDRGIFYSLQIQALLETQLNHLDSARSIAVQAF